MCVVEEPLQPADQQAKAAPGRTASSRLPVSVGGTGLLGADVVHEHGGNYIAIETSVNGGGSVVHIFADNMDALSASEQEAFAQRWCARDGE